jgi:vacuolar-type H+-ATPase subunit C/Vma6
LLDPRYAYMSAYLKGEEPKVVAASHVERMSRMTSMPDALAAIRDTDVGNYLEEFSIKTFDDLDQLLWRYLARRIAHVESFKYLPNDMRKVSRGYVVRYDVSNVKAALQAVSTGEKGRMIPVGIIHDNSLLEELFQVEAVEGIAEILTKCRLGDYAPIVRRYEVSGGAKSKLMVEAKLDGQFYHGLLGMAKDVREGSVLAKAFGLVIDLTNLQIACRATIEGIGPEAGECFIPGGYMIGERALRDLLPLKLGDIPRRLDNSQYRDIANEVVNAYDKTKNITAVAEIIGKHTFILLQVMLSPRALSPLVMAWYLILKETEIRNVRLILKAIDDNVPVEDIRRYLVL